jgi:energy-converting hydrogenase Eha subunit G
MEEAPRAPWSPFPLSELCILLALILIVAGFFTGGDRRGAVLGAGFGLMTLAAGELAVREHFAGYRSHSGLLAGIAALLCAAPIFLLTEIPQEAILAVAVLIFIGAFLRLRGAFVERSGGLGFRA